MREEKADFSLRVVKTGGSILLNGKPGGVNSFKEKEVFDLLNMSMKSPTNILVGYSPELI